MTTDKITEYLEQMAVKLGVAAEHVYGVLVRQQLAEGVVAILVAFVFAALAIWLIRLAFRYFDEWDDLRIVVLAVIVVCFGTVLTAGGSGILHVVNPEYYAIREIMETIRGVVK
ncbi:hypothetical protein G3578_09775 [Brevibacillus sp. SYP-B805]|uniref:hypothetical protein n=1 Tax=Brevibacillus sp. SYP-B805 TaxID=1578199 RepID=UPI0013EC4BE8|nr:hypothetical protein [Brevibacillus sp. SYP-B805]NGQ95441.1 hypothetical protein [Brevibacillus sp. SYP-B805]